MQEIQRIAIGDFIGMLQGIPEDQFEQNRILRLMSRLLVSEESLKPYMHVSPNQYTRNLVFRNELFEVLVLCWGIGHKTPIHNHDNQLGWITVQKGMLSIQNYQRTSCMHGGPGKDPVHCKGSSKRPVELEEVSQIAISSIGAVTTTDREDTIHEIGNLSAFGEPAVSIHVYSRPVDTVVVFDREQKTCQRVQLSYYSEYGKVVAAA